MVRGSVSMAAPAPDRAPVVRAADIVSAGPLISSSQVHLPSLFSFLLSTRPLTLTTHDSPSLTTRTYLDIPPPPCRARSSCEPLLPPSLRTSSGRASTTRGSPSRAASSTSTSFRRTPPFRRPRCASSRRTGSRCVTSSRRLSKCRRTQSSTPGTNGLTGSAATFASPSPATSTTSARAGRRLPSAVAAAFTTSRAGKWTRSP